MENIAVRIGDCTCPETPHPDGDVVYLLPTVPLRLGLACERIIANAREAGTDATTDALMEAFVSFGAVGWNRQYINGRGIPEPKPFDVNDILADYRIARGVAEKADGLYSETIMAPFLEAQQTRSPTGPTGGTTSRRSTRTSSRRKPSSGSTSDGAQ